MFRNALVALVATAGVSLADHDKTTVVPGTYVQPAGGVMVNPCGGVVQMSYAQPVAGAVAPQPWTGASCCGGGAVYAQPVNYGYPNTQCCDDGGRRKKRCRR